MSRIKQALMIVGLGTVLAVVALAGLVAYLWWDTRNVGEEFEADTDYEAGSDVSGTVDTADAEDTDAESGTTAD